MEGNKQQPPPQEESIFETITPAEAGLEPHGEQPKNQDRVLKPADRRARAEKHTPRPKAPGQDSASRRDKPEEKAKLTLERKKIDDENDAKELIFPPTEED